jgi:hypothetical protein
MNVDVEIYISQLLKFFKDNPKDLLNLVPKDKTDIFFEKCRDAAIKNSDKGEEITLTQKQMIDICVEINKGTPKTEDEFERLLREGIFLKAPIGFVCLN